jgi:hypothetical protein
LCGAVYVYTVVVDKWPDWRPDGWQRVYSDFGEWCEDIPEALRALADNGLPYDLSVVDVDEQGGEYAHVVRGRVQWEEDAS